MNSVVKTYEESQLQKELLEEGIAYHIFLYISLLDKDKNFDDDDNDIMSHLNYRKLEEIKKDFMKNEEQGLSLD